MKFWSLILVLAIIAQPVQAGFCDMDMEMNQETPHHMVLSDPDESDRAGHDCCGSDEPESSDGCGSDMDCGSCFAGVSAIPNLARIPVAFGHQHTPGLISGVVLPSHTSPLFRPPIS